MESVRKGEILQVRVLYSEGCANTPPTVELVKKVAHESNVPVNIETVMVSTQEQAQDLRFLGSPTVQIDGLDIELPGFDNLAFGLT